MPAPTGLHGRLGAPVIAGTIMPKDRPSQGATMGEHHQRNCLNRLMILNSEMDAHDHKAVAAEVDRMLVCNSRHGCSAKLTCSWLAAELAAGLAQRYR